MNHMRVKIVYLGLVRSKVGKREEEYEVKDGSSLSDLFNSLAETYGQGIESIFKNHEMNRLDPNFIVTVNGRLKDPLREGEAILGPGDTVALMTLISGGQVFFRM